MFNSITSSLWRFTEHQHILPITGDPAKLSSARKTEELNLSISGSTCYWVIYVYSLVVCCLKSEEQYLSYIKAK